MQFGQLKRREFVTLIGSAAATWPLVALAQQPKRLRRLGILMPLSETEAEPNAWIFALLENLQKLGWRQNETLAVDVRWAGGDASKLAALSIELAEAKPDVLVVNGTPALVALQQVTKPTPIVFVNVIDPVASGMVKSLSVPGGNVTGFTNYEVSMAGKWLELIKDLDQSVARALVIANLNSPASHGLLGELDRVAPALSIVPIAAGVRNRMEIDAAIHEYGRGGPGGALVVLPDVLTSAHYAEIIALAGRYRVPAVYPFRFFAASGGLLSYGVDI